MRLNLDQFVTPRTGTVEALPESERLQAATEFSDLVDDMMLAHARHVNTTKYTRHPNSSSLMLTYPLQGDRRLHIVVSTSQIEVDSFVTSKNITIRETDALNRTYRTHSYGLAPGSIDVIRSDYKPNPSAFLEPAPDDEEFEEDYFEEYEESLDPDEEMDRQLEDRELANQSEFFQAIKTQRQFELIMGMNHLPVGPDEIAKLGQILRVADFIHD